MEPPGQIVSVSHTAELKIRFRTVINVTGKRIALTSLYRPHIQQLNHGRAKRLIKDGINIGETMTAIIKCDFVKDSTVVGDGNTTLSSYPLRCLDVLQLDTARDHELIEVKEPVYHEFTVDTLAGLTVLLHDLHGDEIKFYPNSNVVLKFKII